MMFPRFPVLRFPPMRFGPTFSSPAFSVPAFSVAPSICLHQGRRAAATTYFSSGGRSQLWDNSRRWTSGGLSTDRHYCACLLSRGHHVLRHSLPLERQWNREMSRYAKTGTCWKKRNHTEKRSLSLKKLKKATVLMVISLSWHTEFAWDGSEFKDREHYRGESRGCLSQNAKQTYTGHSQWRNNIIWHSVLCHSAW